MFADTGWVFWTLVSVAGVSLVSFRHTAHTLLRISFIATLSTLAAWLYFRNPPATGSPIQSAAWLCAALSFSWSVSAAVVIGLISGKDRRSLDKDGFVPLSLIVALLFGVASVICHGVVLAMRLIDVGVDLVRGFLVTERIVEDPDQIESIRHCTEVTDPVAEDKKQNPTRSTD